MSAPTTYRGAIGDAGEELTARPGDPNAAASSVHRGGESIYDPYRHQAPPLPGRAVPCLADHPRARRCPIVNTAHAREADVGRHICQIEWRKGDWHVKQLIRCAAGRWSVPGGPDKALYVADRESQLEPERLQPQRGSGIFQHLRRVLARARRLLRVRRLVRVQRPRQHHGDDPDGASHGRLGTLGRLSPFDRRRRSGADRTARAGQVLHERPGPRRARWPPRWPRAGPGPSTIRIDGEPFPHHAPPARMVRTPP